MYLCLSTVVESSRPLQGAWSKGWPSCLCVLPPHSHNGKASARKQYPKACCTNLQLAMPYLHAKLNVMLDHAGNQQVCLKKFKQ